MNTKAGQTAYGQRNLASLSATGRADLQASTDTSTLTNACLDVNHPPPTFHGPEPKTYMNPRDNPDNVNEVSAQDWAAAQAALNPPDPSVLPNGAPNCDYYRQQIDAMPESAKNGMDAASLIAEVTPKAASNATRVGPSDVMAACGFSNALLSTISMVEGDNHDAQQDLTQSQIGFCEAAKNGIPFVTLPLNCPGG